MNAAADEDLNEILNTGESFQALLSYFFDDAFFDFRRDFFFQFFFLFFTEFRKIGKVTVHYFPVGAAASFPWYDFNFQAHAGKSLLKGSRHQNAVFHHCPVHIKK